MIKHCFLHLLFPKSARLCIVIVGLCASFPAVTHAAKPGGGTCTTMVLSYAYSPPRWVARCDPLNVKGFQLKVMFDDTRVFPPTLVIKNPFIDATMTPVPGGVQVTGSTLVTSPGDVDIFELVFIDRDPASAPSSSPSSPHAPIEDAEFLFVASGTDFIDALDTATSQTVHFGPVEIASTTRSVTTGVFPHIWDPDGGYNNGHTGGSGTWQDQSPISWDDLPSESPTTPPPFSDAPWDNNTHAHDIAVFGGDPGNGNVTVFGQILVGGFQFDISGYHIQGGALTLSAPPGLMPIIDTGANNAMISSTIAGSNGLTKVGTGTLALTGANTYTGITTINAGTLLVAGGSGTGNSSVMVNNSGSTFGGIGTVGNSVNVGPSAAVLAGNGTSASGTLTLNNLTLNNGAIIKLALGPAGGHSTLSRAGVPGSFSPNQGFTILNFGAQPGFYDNVVTGVPFDPGTATWHINNPGFFGTFSFDGGNIDLTVSNVPPILTLSNAVSRKNHGAAGPLNIPLPLSSPFGVECRSGGAGGNHSFVFTFTNNVVSGGATVATMGTGSVAGSPNFSGNTMTVNLTGVSDVQLITVTLSGVTDSFAQVLPETAVSVNMLVGDTSGNKAVNATDISQTKLQSGMPVTNANCRQDVVISGTINATDVSLVKARTGSGLPQPAR